MSSSISTVSRQTTITQFACYPFKGSNLDRFYYLLLKATISNGWSFRWVDNPDSITLFKFINPQINLPKRRMLGGKILENASNQLVQEIQDKAQNDTHGVTITLDGWTNVVNQNILGSVLITSSGEVLVWQAKDISGERSRTSEVKEKLVEIINSVKEKNIKISAVVTDSHASYAAAR